jgi:hypothetical protein
MLTACIVHGIQCANSGGPMRRYLSREPLYVGELHSDLVAIMRLFMCWDDARNDLTAIRDFHYLAVLHCLQHLA